MYCPFWTFFVRHNNNWHRLFFLEHGWLLQFITYRHAMSTFQGVIIVNNKGLDLLAFHLTDLLSRLLFVWFFFNFEKIWQKKPKKQKTDGYFTENPGSVCVTNLADVSRKCHHIIDQEQFHTRSKNKCRNPSNH